MMTTIIQSPFMRENDGEKGGANDKFLKFPDADKGSKARGPRWRAYKNFTVRKKSFYSSSDSLKKRAHYFAENGFFFKGYGFCIVCFCCGIELDARDENIDVYTSHVGECPDCSYVQYKERHLRKDDTLQERETCQNVISISANPHEITESTDTGANVELEAEEPMEVSGQVATSLRCKVCLDGQVGITFQPCGHLAACGTCASRLSKCPVCRASIRDKIKTYLS